ncbi:hypothetical protein M9H77_35769 [Catharanthus roseus]|uniref:Uncharacterized protein n=1 Tax=Catharanthus roseus TaxID=4058 RepID=A0ACB9ZQW3_CATRO|nr:hypothetical protein M9H77_35769 [Catharanthus roseus]
MLFSDDTTSSPESPSSVLGYVPSLVTPSNNSILDQLPFIDEGVLFTQIGKSLIRLSLAFRAGKSIPMYVLAALDPPKHVIGLKDPFLTFCGALGMDRIEGIGHPDRRPYAAGGALRSSTGKFHTGFAIALGSNGSNSLAEAKGILYGLKLVRSLANQVIDALWPTWIHFILRLSECPLGFDFVNNIYTYIYICIYIYARIARVG